MADDLGVGSTRAELRAFAKELRAIDKAWVSELRRMYRDLAKITTERAQARAQAMGGIQARSAKAIKPKGDNDAARIQIRPSKAKRSTQAGANIAFWGAKRRTGWYAAERYKASTGRQHPAWVGSSWEVGKKGEGPYALNDAVADSMPRIEAEFAKGITDITRRAFPDGS